MRIFDGDRFTTPSQGVESVDYRHSKLTIYSKNGRNVPKNKSAGNLAFQFSFFGNFWSVYSTLVDKKKD